MRHNESVEARIIAKGLAIQSRSHLLVKLLYGQILENMHSGNARPGIGKIYRGEFLTVRFGGVHLDMIKVIIRPSANMQEKKRKYSQAKFPYRLTQLRSSTSFVGVKWEAKNRA